MRKRILSNFVSLSSVSLISMLIPIVTLPLLTRALGVDGYGALMLINTINLFGAIIIDYSSQSYGIREHKKTENKLSNYIEIQSSRFLLLVIYLVLVSIYISTSIDFITPAFVFIFVLPYLLGTLLLCQWFHLANSDLSMVSFLSILARGINLIGIVLFVKSNNDLTLALFLGSFPVLLAGLIVSFIRRAKYKVPIIAITKPKNFIVNGLPIFITDFAPNLYNNIPVLFFGSISTASQFAFFSLAMRIVNIILIVQNIIMKSIYPILLEKSIGLKKICSFNIIISLLIIIVIYFSKPYILYFLVGSDDFSDSMTLIDILLLGVIFSGLTYSFTYGFLYKVNHDKALSKIMLLSCSLSSVIVISLTISFNEIGLTFGITISRAIILFSLLSLVYRIKCQSKT